MDWLNRKRIGVYTWSLILVFVAVGLYWFVGGSGISDRRNLPMGTDYICFYAASEMAKEGQVLDIYNITKIWEKESEIVGHFINPFGWYYPPTFLLFVYPLSYLPYIVSLTIWISTTLYAYIAVLRRIVPDHLIYGLALAFPGTLQNILHGQNGFLTAALLGWGLLLLQKNAWAGGLILGLLSFKPHLVFLVFVALIAGRYWKALLGAGSSAAILAVSSIIFFNLDVWLAFKQQMPFVTSLIEDGYLPWAKLSTVFALGMLLNLGVKASYAIQGLFTIGTTLAVFLIWYKKVIPFSLKVSFLLAGIFLVTPYAFQYDLVILALAMAWYGWEAYTNGWRPYEKLVLLLIWITPMFNDPVAKMLNIQIVPIILLCFMTLIVRRFLTATHKETTITSAIP